MKWMVTVFLLVLLVPGCGTNKELLMDTKFDAALRQEVASIGEKDPPRILSIEGKCDTTIDAHMRQALIDGGATVQVMEGDTFRGSVSSEDVFKLAALDFINQLRLSKGSNPPEK